MYQYDVWWNHTWSIRLVYFATTQSTYFRLYLTENISSEFYISSDHISLQEPNSCLHDSLFLTTKKVIITHKRKYPSLTLVIYDKLFYQQTKFLLGCSVICVCRTREKRTDQTASSGRIKAHQLLPHGFEGNSPREVAGKISNRFDIRSPTCEVNFRRKLSRKRDKTAELIASWGMQSVKV